MEVARRWLESHVRARPNEQGARVVAVAAVVVTVLVTGCWKFVPAMRGFRDRAAANAALPRLERELAGAHATDIDRTFLIEARRLLPEHARYIVETGPNVQVSTSTTLPSVHGYSLFWLLPRRQVRDTDPQGRPGYVLCFGCALAPLRPRLQILWDNHHGVVIARFRT
jgi:hypothetical protein